MKQRKLQIEELRTIIDKFEIGDPLKTLFNPSFSLCFSFARGEQILITLQMSAPDALGRHPVAPVQMQQEFPPRLLHPDIYDPDHYEKLIADFLREMLHYMMKHEADESIKFAGRRVYDPHDHLAHIHNVY